MKNEIKDFELFLWEKELSKSTIYVYMYTIKNYFTQFDELTKSNLIEWKKQLLNKVSPKTVNIRITAIGEYLKFINRNDLCLRKIKIQQSTSIENIITKEEVNKYLCGFKNENKMRYYYLILFLAKTGARVSEIIQFKLSDLKQGFCELHTKGKIRRIFFAKSLQTKEIFDYFNYKKDGDYLFDNRYGYEMTSRGISQILKKYANKYGIELSHAHPHAFRHYFAIEFLKRDNNISLLADLMGHSSINTTAIYTRLTEEEQQKRLNDAMNW